MSPETTIMTTPTVELQGDDLKPYVVKFTIVYTLSCIVVSLIAWFLDSMFEIDLPETVINISTTLAGVIAACHAFVKTQGRLFSKSERKYMTWASFIMSWVVSILMSIILILGFSAFLGDELFDAISVVFSALKSGSYLMMFMLVMGLLAIISWFMMYWMYGSFAKSALKAFEKSKSKK